VTCLWPLAASFAASLQGVLRWRPASDEQLLSRFSEKDCAIVSSQTRVSIQAAGVIELADSAHAELKDPKTGEVLAHVRYRKLDGGRLAKSTLTPRAQRHSLVRGWPPKMSLCFSSMSFPSSPTSVERAHEAFPADVKTHFSR